MQDFDVFAAELARVQHGAVARGQLIAGGWDDARIARRLAVGGFVRRAAGVYALSSAVASFELEVMCAVLHRPGSVVARTWAAAWWGLRGYSREDAAGPVDLAAPLGTASSRLAVIERSRHLEDHALLPMTTDQRASVLYAARDRRRISKGGFANARTVRVPTTQPKLSNIVRRVRVVPRVTSPVRTVIDLARVGRLAPHVLDRLIDDALSAGLVTVDDLADCLERSVPPRSPGRAELLSHIRKRAGGYVAPDSELERKGRAAFRSWGCPVAVANHPIPGRARQPGRVDFAFPSHKVVIELDGRRWHQSEAGFQSDRDRDRAALMAGWKPFRFTWADFTTRRNITRIAINQIFGLRS